MEISPFAENDLTYVGGWVVIKSVTISHGQALLLDSYVVKKFLRSVQHEAGNLGPKLQPRGGFFGP